MGEFVDLIDKVKKYYKFPPSELRQFIITILAIAFIISFRDWGAGREINVIFGLVNFFNAILITTLTFLIRFSVQKIAGLHIGLRAEYRMWSFGLLFGLIIAFLTNGKVWLLLPYGILVHHMAGHRLLWFRYGINPLAIGMVSLFGPITSIAISFSLKIVYALTASPLVHKMFLLNIALAIYTMMPIPPLDGNRVLFGGRLFYVFMAATIIFAAIFLAIDIPLIFALLGSLLAGAIAWLLYYIFYERFAWQGPGAGWK